ncbi:hypothetical protein [Vreelandella utahensis]|uniref:hypothetical protein n=1 Tax=Vreelandella halophila TaxID=86177 RepID=UPI001179E525|nr:hypothetical protein [Halomonas utahensis]
MKIPNLSELYKKIKKDSIMIPAKNSFLAIFVLSLTKSISQNIFGLSLDTIFPLMTGVTAVFIFRASADIEKNRNP